MVEGQLKLANNNNYPDADDTPVALTNNGIMFLFHEVKYLLNDKEIERIFNPGHATTMKGL